MIEELLEKLNLSTHRRQKEPESLLYQFREQQAQQNLGNHIVLYGAVGYELPKR